MLYLVRTQKMLILVLFIMQLNLYNLFIHNDEAALWMNILFYLCIGITLLLFITSFKFKIEETQLSYELTILGFTWFTKRIPISNIERIEMKEVPDNRIAVHLKKGISFVVNDFKMKHIDDELADFSARHAIEFKDTRAAYLKKNKH